MVFYNNLTKHQFDRYISNNHSFLFKMNQDYCLQYCGIIDYIATSIFQNYPIERRGAWFGTN